MKTFISDIFPKLQKFSKELDDLTLLCNQHWVSIDNISTNKTTYIFRNTKDLIIANNGKVEKAKWEYLGNNSLLIDRENESYLFKHGFFDENILALKVDGNLEYAIFVNENKYDGELNSIEKIIDFLKNKYLSENNTRVKEKVTGFKIEEIENENVNILTDEDIVIQRIYDEQEKKTEKVLYTILIFILIVILLAYIIGII